MRTLTPEQMVKALGMLAADAEWKRELRTTYREVAKVGAGLGRAGMRSSGKRQLIAAARGVRGASNSTAGYVRVSGRVPTSTTPMSALAPVFGTKGPTGWLANARHAGTTARNNPSWIGASWRVAVRGEGPRGINDALAAGTDQMVAEFEKGALKLIDRAF